MKTVLMSFLVVLTINSCFGQEHCTQGHEYNDDCNVCRCGDTGFYVCTRRTCYNGPQFPDSPTPAKKKRQAESGCDKGEQYHDGCNSCRCVDNKFYACTLMACFHGPLFDDTVTLKETITATEPSKKFDEVSESLKVRREIQESTGKYDPPKPNALPFLRYEVDRCAPYEVKNVQCNRCKCTKNGKGWLCTQKTCRTVAKEE